MRLTSSIQHRRADNGDAPSNGIALLYWAAIFLTLAVITAVVGFGHYANEIATAGRMLCLVFVSLFVVTLLRSAAGK